MEGLVLELVSEEENSNGKRHVHPSVCSSTTTNSQDVETSQVSTDRGMDEEDEGYTNIQQKTAQP